MPKQFQQELEYLEESTAMQMLVDTSGSIEGCDEGPLRNSGAESRELPNIKQFFVKIRRLRMSKAVPEWFEREVVQMKPDLKLFTCAKKIYEVERMAAAVRLVLGEIPHN